MTDPPYRIGVALSGGGARGLAHAGALQAMDEAGIRPDVIAGVSAGSIVAVLYAAGVRPTAILDTFSRTNFNDFTELNLGKGSVFRIERVKKFIMRVINPHRNLEDLGIPVYIGVTDLDHGVPAVFHTGPAGDLVSASCAIPVIFPPVCIDGINYVDGGVLRNLPAWAIRSKCRTLIGVNVSPLADTYNPHSMISTALRTYHLMAKANQFNDMAMCDISVATHEIARRRPFDLRHADKIFESGYNSMRTALEQYTSNPDNPSLTAPTIPQ